HEAGLAPAEAQVDRARREVARDLGRRRRQRVQQDEPHGRLERSGEPLGQRAGVVAARVGGYRELLTEVADIGREVHDVSMTSLWRHYKSIWSHPGAEVASGPGLRLGRPGHPAVIASVLAWACAGFCDRR